MLCELHFHKAVKNKIYKLNQNKKEERKEKCINPKAKNFF